MSKEKRTLDIVNGNLFHNFLIFAPPLMLSNLLQCLFHSADTFVVGHFSGENALAAVGSTTMLLSLFVWSLGGLSAGTDVVTAQLFGQQNKEGIKKAVHTSISIALLIGCFFLILGQLAGRAFLQLMSVPSEILDSATLYVRIFLLSMPFTALYNFGAAIIRSSGDTKRPTIYLSIGGALNVVLNIFFVVVLGIDVAGVAIASVASQVVSASLVVLHLIRKENELHLDIKELRIEPLMAKRILAIGLPSALQSEMFSISNVFVQSSINTFGELAIAGNTAAITLEEFMYISMSSVYQTCVTFTGYNAGAKRLDNIKKVLAMSLMLTVGFSLSTGLLELVFGRQLLGLFTSNPVVIDYGMLRIKGVICFLFLNGIMDVVIGSMRGMGTSTLPSILTVGGICGIRVGFIKTYFQMHRTIKTLYFCFPLSWAATSVIQVFVWMYVYKRFVRRSEML